MNAALNVDMVREWLGILHGRSPGLLGISAAGATPGERFTNATVESIDDAARHVEQLDRAGKQGIYHRVTTLRERPPQGQRGSAAMSLTFPGLWADIDIAGPGHKTTEPLPPDEDAARKVVEAAGLPEPTRWIHSGGGMYPWWLLAEPHILGDDLPRVEEMSRRWQLALEHGAKRLGYHYGNVGDLARILRIPGTVNRKEGLSRPCLLLPDIGPSYTLAELHAAAEAATPPPPPSLASAGISAAQEAFWRDTDRHHDGPGPFDALADAARWADILEPHGWTFGDDYGGAGGGEIWNRPGGSSGLSALCGRNGIPTMVVHSTEAGLPSGAGHHLTKGRVFAHLNFRGDESAAATALRAAAAGDPTADRAAASLPAHVLTRIAQRCNIPRWTAPPAPPQLVPQSSDEGAEEAAGDPVELLLAELLDAGDLDGIPAPEPIIIDTLFVDTVARLWGESGSFKSFITLDMAGCVGTGLPFHGRRTRRGLVVYVVAEGVRGVRKRVRAWEQHHGQKMTGVRFLPRPVQSRSPEWDVLIAACARLRPALIVIDTQARVTVGVEENSATEMGVFVDKVEKLRAASGACVLLVHHTGVDVGRGRGSTTVKGAMQSELSVSRKGKGASNVRVTLSTGKQKDDDELGDMEFCLRIIELDGEADELGRPITSVVLEPVDPSSAAEVGEGSAAHIALLLDRKGYGRNIGRELTRKACEDLGVKAGTDKLREIVKLRKNLSSDLSYSSVGDSDLPEKTGIEESAGQTCTGQVEDNIRTGTPRPDLTSPLSMGEVRQDSPVSKDGQTGVCGACGDPMTLITPGQTHHPNCDPA